MARAKKNKTAEAVLPLTPANVLKNLLNKHRRSKNAVGEINDEMRESVSNAVENNHLHRGAFNIVKRLHAMQDEKLAELHHHLLAYMDSAGIDERVAKVARLPLGDDDGEDDGKVVSMKAAE